MHGNIVSPRGVGASDVLVQPAFRLGVEDFRAGRPIRDGELPAPCRRLTWPKPRHDGNPTPAVCGRADRHSAALEIRQHQRDNLMSRPTPTHPRSVAFAIRIPGEGWAMDRNGQLLVFATHADAVTRARTVKGQTEIEPLDLSRMMQAPAAFAGAGAAGVVYGARKA